MKKKSSKKKFLDRQRTNEAKKKRARHLTCGVCQSNLHINVQRIGHILCYLYMVLCDVEFVRWC